MAEDKTLSRSQHRDRDIEIATSRFVSEAFSICDHDGQGNRYERLFIDEALMLNAGEILFAANLAKVPEVMLIGDTNQIPYINRTTEPESELICETALFQITLKKEVVKVLGVYRPPSANLNNAIDILLDQLEGALQTKTKIILMGDVNVDNLVANSDNSKLEELLSSFDIIRESLPPTRITAESAKSIDWICTNIRHTTNPNTSNTIGTL
ncbi:hypothetical protein J6590_073340 [Homalodisca vitripennis]|nr:hypothetical protein J6590_073340 [Homalodisca vitripennis]